MHARWSRVRGDVARFSREHLLSARIVCTRVRSRVLACSHRLQGQGREYRLEPVDAVGCWIKSNMLFANVSAGGACAGVIRSVYRNLAPTTSGNLPSSSTQRSQSWWESCSVKAGPKMLSAHGPLQRPCRLSS